LKEQNDLKIKNALLQYIGIIKRYFRQMDSNTFIKLYKRKIQSQLDYAVNIWSPNHRAAIEDIENVQKG